MAECRGLAPHSCFAGAHCLANRPGTLVRLTFQIGLPSRSSTYEDWSPWQEWASQARQFSFPIGAIRYREQQCTLNLPVLSGTPLLLGTTFREANISFGATDLWRAWEAKRGFNWCSRQSACARPPSPATPTFEASHSDIREPRSCTPWLGSIGAPVIHWNSPF